MAGQFQGFDKNLNLLEAIADRDIINNLANSPIGDDIQLFVNNVDNVSELIVESDNVEGSTIKFNSLTPSIFSTGTEVKVDGVTYKVVESRRDLLTGGLSFELTDTSDVLVLDPPVGIYSRSDTIQAVNFDNLRPLIKKAVENKAQSTIPEIQFYGGVNPYFSIGLTMELAAGTNGFPAIAQAAITDVIDSLKALKINSLFTDTDFLSDNDITSNAPLKVTDPDGLNVPTAALVDTSPGIYISNPEDGGTKRIFSSNDNVWSESGSDLVCASREILVGDLAFEQNIKFTTNTSLLEAQAGLADRDFTHFVRVLINGEEYSLCLIREETAS
jgi:hypothetical protein